MSENIAKYFFLPWLRRGISQLIDIPDDAASSPYLKRATFPLVLSVRNWDGQTIGQICRDGGNDDEGNPCPKVNLFGPGDVVGFDHNLVIRIEPKNNVADFEPNYFPFVEFSEPDFPWCYTPANPTSGQPLRLKPWICLIVLKAPGQEGAEYIPGIPDPSRPLPYIRVLDTVRSLPDLGQSWAWAHVQLTTGASIDMGNPLDIAAVRSEINGLLVSEPERVISRLMCPRKLEPQILYHAFVVPAFELGRKAGLGEVFANERLLDPAWTSEAGQLDVPYYFKWEFRTGLRGDFEYLVRLLKPRILDKKVGTRMMDCSKPGFEEHVPTLVVSVPETDWSSHALGLEGALKSISTKSTEWPDPNAPGRPKNEFQVGLKGLLDLPAENLKNHNGDPPWITPPIYGCWHAARHTVNPEAYGENWLDTLNLDPRYRAMAGIGTRVIKDQQEALMAAAWKQVGAIDTANQLLRQAQLSRAVGQKIHENHLQKMSLGDALRTTSAVNSRALIDSADGSGDGKKVTVKYHIGESPIPPSAIDPAFRRIRRMHGPIRKRQHLDDIVNRKDILERLNEGEVAAAGEAPLPTPSLGMVSEEFRSWWAKGFLWKILRIIPTSLGIIAILLIFVAWLLNRFGVMLPPNYRLVATAQVLLLVAAFLLNKFVARGNMADRIREEVLTGDLVREVQKKPPKDFRLTAAGDFNEQVGDEQSAREWGNLAAAIQDFLNSAPPTRPKPKPIDLARVRETVLCSIDPRKTIPQRIRERLVLNLGILPHREDELEPIMIAPTFDTPMYEPLRDLSQHLLLPGLQYVPENTIGLCVTNDVFVRAVLVGNNHGFAEELLWREYPTDQRGSYFRRFWDYRCYVPNQKELEEIETDLKKQFGERWAKLSNNDREAEIERALKETLNDIKPLHAWRDIRLDAKTGLQRPGSSGNMVLIVRGDVLKKYPSTVVYAARAVWDSDKRSRQPIFDHSDENTRTPIFSGTLQPDITFFGFDLSVEEAKGSLDANASKPGWFLVLEQRCTEPRFGLDVYEGETALQTLDTWEDLSWGHFIGSLPPSGYASSMSATPIDKVKRLKADKSGDEIIEPSNVTWNSHAANRAWITLQKPMRIAVHADDMIPEENTQGG